MTTSTVPAIPQNIIITPLLSGCSSLAQACPDLAELIDCDSVPGAPDPVTPVLQRRRWLAEHVAKNLHAPFLCLPILPSEEYLDMVSAVVILPPAEFNRRMAMLGSGVAVRAHRAAAVAMRDDAIKMAAIRGLTPLRSLAEAPGLRDIRVPIQYTTKHKRGHHGGQAADDHHERPAHRTGRYSL